MDVMGNMTPNKHVVLLLMHIKQLKMDPLGRLCLDCCPSWYCWCSISLCSPKFPNTYNNMNTCNWKIISEIVNRKYSEHTGIVLPMPAMQLIYKASVNDLVYLYQTTVFAGKGWLKIKNKLQLCLKLDNVLALYPITYVKDIYEFYKNSR